MKLRNAAMTLYLATGTLSLAVPEASAACTSHFYNNSAVPWTISGQDGGNNALIISQGTAAAIQWSPLATYISVATTIDGHLSQRQFQVHPMAGCFIIVQRANAGPILLNQPVMGDLTIVRLNAKGSSR